MEPFIGQIMMFAGTYAPKDWAFCHGQLLAIVDHQALFAIIGTTYGGDGRTNFALPDLRGRAPIGQGMGRGLTQVSLGQQKGYEQITLMQSQLPDVSIGVPYTTEYGTQSSPENGCLAVAENGLSPLLQYAPVSKNEGVMSGSVRGEGAPISVTQPSLGVNYIIALTGIFPPRS